MAAMCILVRADPVLNRGHVMSCARLHVLRAALFSALAALASRLHSGMSPPARARHRRRHLPRVRRDELSDDHVPARRVFIIVGDSSTRCRRISSCRSSQSHQVGNLNPPPGAWHHHDARVRPDHAAVRALAVCSRPIRGSLLQAFVELLAYSLPTDHRLVSSSPTSCSVCPSFLRIGGCFRRRRLGFICLPDRFRARFDHAAFALHSSFRRPSADARAWRRDSASTPRA